MARKVVEASKRKGYKSAGNYKVEYKPNVTSPLLEASILAREASNLPFKVSFHLVLTRGSGQGGDNP